MTHTTNNQTLNRAFASIFVGVAIMLITGAITVSITTWQVATATAKEFEKEMPIHIAKVAELDSQYTVLEMSVQQITETRLVNQSIIRKNTEVLTSVDKSLSILTYSLSSLADQTKELTQKVNANTARLNRSGM